MQLILTHEQADFDALAALFAASLLGDGLPVLPRRTNRNVRAFLTLYGLEFPFIDPNDLPQGAIETITLVDTQALITLKGMSRQTKVIVFDHHPDRTQSRKTTSRGPGADWDVTIIDLGATTTYFTEILQERGEELTPIQASLLLLGIYEDTGTLTFSRTTARDVHAVGWLLEQGAVLGMVADFLNLPLSNEQRELYDRLVAGIEDHNIHGHRVLLACGQAPNVTDEISTLAHKLRDLLDPDALFVLVQTPEGVRCVARSGTDEIDVAAIMAHLGGGGHNRAAAALIRREAGGDETRPLLDEVRENLLAVLPQHVRPAISVAQIMSRRPHAISATTHVSDAAKLMSRYGYEGFPVVADGKVIGLLTRRAVDRALNHGLNLTASSLMEAGSNTVVAGDSLQRLQSVMADSGWGQIPVVDAQTQKIIGIVTRTDLLKTLARRHAHSAGGGSLAGKLEKSLSGGKLEIIRAAAEEAAREHLPLYIVGGFVRDLLLKLPGADLDMVVEGDAIALGQSMTAKYGGRLTSHTRFGTARWYITGSAFSGSDIPEFLDLVSARHEFYEKPSALPTVEHGSIKLDLHRRDFTINTLAVRLDGRHFGELHDYYGGVSDLERRLVRVLHSLSFVEDPTRMLRAVRYEQRYGFEIEPRTLQLMDESLLHVSGLSDERVRHELDMILGEAKYIPMLARLDELNLLHAIAPELPWSAALGVRLKSALAFSKGVNWGEDGQRLEGHQREAILYCLWLMDLPADAIHRLHARLRFPVATLDAILAAAALQRDLPSLAGARPSAWVERLEGLSLLAVYAVYLASHEAGLELFATRWRHIHALTNGETLKERGLTPGPAFKEILSSLRRAWLDGEIDSAAGEERMLGDLLK